MNTNAFFEIFKVKLFQVKMLKARGYEILYNNDVDERFFVDDTLSIENKYETFKLWYTKFDSLNTMYVKRNDSDNTSEYTYVQFYDKSPDSVKELLNKLTCCDIVIFVCKTPFSTAVKKYINEFIPSSINANPKYIDVFTYDDLLLDTVNHFLSPKITIVTDLSVINNVSSKFLPIISSNDATIKYFGFRAGTIVRILRRESFVSEIVMPENITYAVVKFEKN